MSSPAAAAWQHPRLFRRFPRLPLALLLAGHLLLGLGYGLHTPLFESPDEPGHYLYVRYLQVYRHLPVQGPEFQAPRAHHPPGYYALGALLTGWIDIGGSPDAIQAQLNPKFGFRAGDPVFDNRAALVHNGPEERFPYGGQARTVHLLRLLSLAFSGLAVLFSYGAARDLRPGQPGFALLAAGLVAFNPMVLFSSGLVSNDTGALAAGAAVVYLLSRGFRRGFTLRRWLWVGLACGAGLLLKSSALLLGVPAALLLAHHAACLRRPRPVAQSIAALALPPLLMAGWWYARNAVVYGDWTGNAAVGVLNGLVTPQERWSQLLPNITWMLKTTFGCGPIGPTSLCLPWPAFAAAAALALAALAGAGVGLYSWRQAGGRTRLFEPVPSAPLPDPPLLWAMHGLLIVATVAGAVAYALTYHNCWQGRFLYPAFPSLALLLAAGWLAWFRPARHAPAAWTTTGLMLAAGAYGLFGLLLPAYGIPRAPWPLELGRATPLEAQVGLAARVLAYRLDRTEVRPGGVLAVTVYWQTLQRTDRPYTVFLHLYSPDLGSLAQRDTYPGLGNYATTAWDPGRTFVDVYRLYLPADAPPVEGAMLLLGLYDEATGERLPVTGRNAGPPDARWVQFGQVSVAPTMDRR